MRRGVTAGTVIALVLAGLVLTGMLPVLLHFSGSPGTFAHGEDVPAAAQAPPTARAAARPTPAPTAAPAPAQPSDRRFTLTAGGTVAVEKAVRNGGYYADSRTYDFDEVFSLLRQDVQADITLVSLENLVVDGAKSYSDLLAPAPVMRMLQKGGFDTVALGFKRAWEQGTDGMASTLNQARAAGLQPIGAFDSEGAAAPAAQIRTVNGVRVALMHFTASPSKTSASKIKKDGRLTLYPTTDQAPAAIAAARSAGAEAVIVSVHWGSEGNATPTKAQRKVAAQLADAGADVIIGYGARRVQTAEWLTGTLPDGTPHQTLCAWCLGCLLSESRSDGAVAGMLLHLTIRVDRTGGVHIDRAAYTPTFVWRYDFNGKNAYRVVSTVRDAPDGMTQDQRSAFGKALERTRKNLRDAPLTEVLP